MGILTQRWVRSPPSNPEAATSGTSIRAACRPAGLIARCRTIAAFAYRHSRGQPYVYPDNELSYSGNFLNMLFKMTELR